MYGIPDESSEMTPTHTSLHAIKNRYILKVVNIKSYSIS